MALPLPPKQSFFVAPQDGLVDIGARLHGLDQTPLCAELKQFGDCVHSTVLSHLATSAGFVVLSCFVLRGL